MKNHLQKFNKFLLAKLKVLTNFIKKINLKNAQKLTHLAIHKTYQIVKTLKKHFKVFRKHPSEYTKWLLNKIKTKLLVFTKIIYSYIKKPKVYIPIGAILILFISLFSAYSYFTHPPRVNEQIIKSKLTAQQYLELVRPLYSSELTQIDTQTDKAHSDIGGIDINVPNKFILSLTLNKHDLTPEMENVDNNHDNKVYSSIQLHIDYLNKLNDLILPLTDLNKDSVETVDLTQFVNEKSTALQQINANDYSLDNSPYSDYQNVLQQMESDAYEYSQTKNLVRWASQYQQQRQALIQIYQNDVNTLIYSDITKLSELFSDYERIEFLLKKL